MKDLLSISAERLAQLGIVDWGYTEELEASSWDKLDRWVEDGLHGPLGYLADQRKEARKSLTNVEESCQSALVFLFDYKKTRRRMEAFYRSEKSNGLRLASYTLAYDDIDYHLVIPEKLNELANELGIKARPVIDIQPILDRDLAWRAGLGWFGKNSMLIHREKGSFFFIGSLLLGEKLPIETREKETDHCGQCTACIDACPTSAIDAETRTLVADKCISTWTIEVFKEGPEAPKGMEKGKGELFGCDICNDVCPWNREMDPIEDNSVVEINLVKDFLMEDANKLLSKLESSSNKAFQKTYRPTPLARTGRPGIIKNLKHLLSYLK